MDKLIKLGNLVITTAIACVACDIIRNSKTAQDVGDRIKKEAGKVKKRVKKIKENWD